MSLLRERVVIFDPLHYPVSAHRTVDLLVSSIRCALSRSVAVLPVTRYSHETYNKDQATCDKR